MVALSEEGLFLPGNIILQGQKPVSGSFTEDVKMQTKGATRN